MAPQLVKRVCQLVSGRYSETGARQPDRNLLGVYQKLAWRSPPKTVSQQFPRMLGSSRPRKDLTTMAIPSIYTQAQPDMVKHIAKQLESIVSLLATINQKLDQLIKARSSET
jgi:hypothetical protein